MNIREFGSLRQNIFYNHISNYFNLNESSDLTLSVYPANSGEITISGLTPPEYPWEAEYFNQIPFDLKAIAHPGYRFSHWEGILSTHELKINTVTPRKWQSYYEVPEGFQQY